MMYYTFSIKQPCINLNKRNTYHYLKRLKKGDKNSFRWVYDQYYDQIYYFLSKLIPQKSMAEEATADVFVTLWNKRAIIDPNKEIKAFLYKVARDNAWNYLKKIANDSRLEKEYLENYQFSNSGIELKNGESFCLEKEQLLLLNNIIETLPPKRLQVFKLRYFEGLDNMKIGQELGVSVNTVKTHLLKAKRYLKERMVKEHEFYWNLILIWLFK